MSMIPTWLTAAAKAVDRVTRKPIAAIRRRVIRNAAREKLSKNENREEPREDDDK